MASKEIHGLFSDDELHAIIAKKPASKQALTTPKHLILAHPGFERIILPNGEKAILAYKSLYSPDLTDLDIELLRIAKYEQYVKQGKKEKEAKVRLKYHYKKAISIVSPKLSQGWNRWSDNILDLFIANKSHKVLWGSGNCGKSAVMALLLYIKWRVNPSQRMVVIASKVLREAQTRVFAYIKEIHMASPMSSGIEIAIKDSADEKGIFHILVGEDGKKLPNYRGCIASLPIKVNSINDEVGANLLGKHPDDCLVVAFDEAQELPGRLEESRIFTNWYTNENIEVFAWGNPMPVDINAPESHDILFKLGAKGLSIGQLKDKEKHAEKTTSWAFSDTAVLHLAMTDSPKDDPDEAHYFLDRGDGVRQQRLHFLAGADSVEKIAARIPKDSPTWFSQVLGFPYIHTTHSKNASVITPFMVREAARYPLIWLKQSFDYYMGVDPASSGKNDEASIVVVKTGTMEDGRHGVDVMGGENCVKVSLTDNEDFVDSIVEAMWGFSQKLNIPLRNLSVETHGVGEVLRYALQRHIEDGKWKKDYENGHRFHVVSPMIGATERPLFRLLGDMKPAEEMVANVITEYWIAARCMILSRQLFNVPEFILQQFYNRHLTNKAGSMKYKVETKEEMGRRGVYSPNDADALCNALDLIRYRGFKYKFYNRGKYVADFGPEYQEKQSRKEVDNAMFGIADMLGVGNNLRKYRETEVKTLLKFSDMQNKNNIGFESGGGSGAGFNKRSFGTSYQKAGDGRFGIGDLIDKRRAKKSKGGIDVI